MRHVNQKNQIYKFYFTCNLRTIYNRNKDDGIYFQKAFTLHQRAKICYVSKDICVKSVCVFVYRHM